MNKRLRLGIGVVVAAAIATATAVVAAPADAAGGPRGTGIGTKAALKADTCDPDTALLRFPHPFGVPQCVVPLEKGQSNGGATSPGVTKDSVKVVVLLPPAGTALTAATKVTDQATGQEGSVEDAIEDTAAVFFDTVFETWGRTPKFEYVTASGTDEAAQRADALEVAAMKPFLVFDYLGQSTFAKEIASRKIVSFSLTSSVDDTLALAPYLWRPATGWDTLVSNTAELVCKGLVGRDAQWAGDASLQTKERKFGIFTEEGNASVNVDLFTGPAKKCGAEATLYTYKPATDTAEAAATAETAMQTLVPKMKSDGITTVIMFSGANAAQTAITEEATKQEYSPEWLVTGVGYSDIDVTARMRNQEQWAHAFGIAGLIPAVTSDASTPSTTTYQWYWGTNNGTIGVWPWGLVENLAIGLHNAGPKLTPETFRDGMFALPAQGGAASDQITTVQMAMGKQAKLPYELYMWGGDFALVWWDPAVTGASNVVAIDGQGKYVWLNGGRRYQAGQLPKGEPTYFSMDGAIVSLDSRPASDVSKDYPCTGCPSSGGA